MPGLRPGQGHRLDLFLPNRDLGVQLRYHSSQRGRYAVAQATSRREPSAGRGEDLRLAGDRVIGSGLELEGELLQLSAFTGEAGRPDGRIARPSRRR